MLKRWGRGAGGEEEEEEREKEVGVDVGAKTTFFSCGKVQIVKLVGSKLTRFYPRSHTRCDLLRQRMEPFDAWQNIRLAHK
jgi:hypothetical protein